MDILMDVVMGKPLWMWGVFFSIIFFLLALDLGVLNRKDHAIGIKESLLMSAFYIAIGVAYGGFVWYALDAQSGKEYLTGYLVEKSLSLDNIFVISLVFSFFAVPSKYQHRVLFWGILGVIFLRGIMIGLGATLIERFHWILFIFAAFLIFSGVKMLFIHDDKPDIGKNPVLKFLRAHFRITDKLYGHDFIARLPDETGKKHLWLTPLLITLIMVEIIDVVFAVDSVPAVFSITLDPFVVYTSNIFAILGLRALYFALAAIIHRFKYLKQALALVLIFIGSKVFIVDMLDLEKFPASLSLGITLTLLCGGIGYSLYRTKGGKL